MTADDEKTRNREKVSRELIELWQKILRQELTHRITSREQFEMHERIIGRKVRQLRLERGWTQADLAARLDEVGWPLDQTTISNLELGRRPVRVAESDALALAFGIPMLALWYLPVTGEPWSIHQMRKRLADIDSRIKETEDHLSRLIRDSVTNLADHEAERMRVAQAISEAALAMERGEMERLSLSREETEAFIDAMDDERRAVREQMTPHDELLERIESGEPKRLASEAYRMHQDGASPAEIGLFLAEAMPRDVSDPDAAAAAIVAEAIGQRVKKVGNQSPADQADQRAAPGSHDDSRPR